MMTTWETVKPGAAAGPLVTKGANVTVHAEGNVQQADGSLFKFWSTKGKRQRHNSFRRRRAADGTAQGDVTAQRPNYTTYAVYSFCSQILGRSRSSTRPA